MSPRIVRIVLAIVLSAAFALPAGAHEGAFRRPLAATGVAPHARGVARCVLATPTDARLDVAVRGLDRAGSYAVVANGVTVATLRTTGHGTGRARLRSHPRGRAVLLGFDPRGARISVRDGNGHDVLAATMPDTHHDPAVTGCCMPSRHAGSACAEQDTSTCATMGGTVTGASCLPDPCTTTPPDGSQAVVCCHPGDDPAETPHMGCDDHGTMEACVARAGTAVTAATCMSAPCDPPPAADVAACCLDDHHGMGCWLLTAAQCAERGGTLPGAATCAADACGGHADDGSDGMDGGHMGD